MSNLVNNEIKETMVNNIIKAIEKYNWNYTRTAIEKIVDVWANNKGNLISILSKHPNWNPEKMYIHFNADYTRSFDPETIKTFADYIANTLYGNDYANYMKKHREKFLKIYDYEKRGYYDSRKKILWFFSVIYNNIDSSTVSKKLEEEMNDFYPELKAKQDQKISRLINKYCCMCGLDKDEDYNRKFAKLGDSLNPIKYTRHTVLSVNPVDYLYMSNGNSWASCHSIDVNNVEKRDNNYGGCYCGGTMSYMLDESSMVYYTVNSNADDDNLEFEYKENRQMFHYGNQKLLQARLYPQSNDSTTSNELKANIRAIVQKIFADCLEIDNYWKVTTNYNCNHVITCNDSSHYKDYEEYTCYMSYQKENGSLDNTGDPIYIGYPTICIECGHEGYCEDNTINCCSGRPDQICCQCCGDIIDREDAYEFNGEYYCNDCVVYSDIMNCYIPEEEKEKVTIDYCGHYDYVTTEYARNSFNIDVCDSCGNYYLADSSEMDNYCPECVEEMACCEDCGCRIGFDEEHYLDGMCLCEDCYDNRMESENDEENSLEEVANSIA